MAPTRQKGATPPALEINGAEVPDATTTGDDIQIIDDGTTIDTSQQQGGDPGIEDLKRQLDAANARAANLAAEADSLRNARQNDQREVADNRVLVLDATIQRQEGEKKAILDRIKTAKEAGDYDAEVDATDLLSQINIDLKQTKLGKARLENELEQRQGGDDLGADDPIEKFIKDNNTHPKAARWLREHREYALDASKNPQLIRAHNFALGHDGVEMNSDRYFELLEQRLGLRQGDDDQGGQQERQTFQQERQQMPPSAPPSRGNGLGSGSRVLVDHGEGRVVQDMGNGKLSISKAMADYAISIGMTPKDYAENAIAIARGKAN